MQAPVHEMRSREPAGRVSSVRTTSVITVLLGDGRLPTGGHVHSGGLEQARADGLLSDLADLEALLLRRLRTTGLVAAGIAAAACSRPGDYALLDAETDARTPSPAQREASRAQGRGLLRLAAASWPVVSVDLAWSALGRRPHHAVVLGCAVAAADLAPPDAATCAAYLAVSGPATAAQRLMALDPVAVAALTVRLAPQIDAVAARAVDALVTDAGSDVRPGPTRVSSADLPTDGDPLMDLLAQRHVIAEERLFVS